MFLTSGLPSEPPPAEVIVGNLRQLLDVADQLGGILIVPKECRYHYTGTLEIRRLNIFWLGRDEIIRLIESTTGRTLR